MVLEQFIIDADIIWDQVGKTFFENPEAKPGRIMRVQVVNAGVVEDLTGYTLNLGWTSVRDPSKFGLDAFDDVDITKGIFEIEYTSGMLTNIGPLNASLQLVPPGEGRPIESNNFKLTVKNSAINPGAIQGETSFSTLENALVEVNGWNARIDVVEQEFKDRADALDEAYPVRLTAAEQSVAAVEAQVDLLNRGLGETMPTMASLLAAYPTGDTRDHIVAGNIAEVDTLTVTAIPTVAGNITITLNGVAKTVAVDPAVQTTTALLATLIRGTAFTGWTTGGTESVITFTSTTTGARTGPTFSGGTTGVTGTFVVTVNGVNPDFHRYFWNGSVWADGGAYQAVELIDGSATRKKRTLLGEWAMINSPVVINTVAKTIYISSCNIDYGGGRASLGAVTINVPTEVWGGFYLIFDTKTQTFLVGSSNNWVASTASEGALFCGLWYSNISHYFNCTTLTIDGSPAIVHRIKDSNLLHAQTMLLNTVTDLNKFIDIDIVNNKLKIPNGTYYLLYKNKLSTVSYTSDTELDLGLAAPTPVRYIVVDTTTSKLAIKAYSTLVGELEIPATDIVLGWVQIRNSAFFACDRFGINGKRTDIFKMKDMQVDLDALKRFQQTYEVEIRNALMANIDTFTSPVFDKSTVIPFVKGFTEASTMTHLTTVPYTLAGSAKMITLEYPLKRTAAVDTLPNDVTYLTHDIYDNGYYIIHIGETVMDEAYIDTISTGLSYGEIPANANLCQATFSHADSVAKSTLLSNRFNFLDNATWTNGAGEGITKGMTMIGLVILKSNLITLDKAGVIAYLKSLATAGNPVKFTYVKTTPTIYAAVTPLTISVTSNDSVISSSVENILFTASSNNIANRLSSIEADIESLQSGVPNSDVPVINELIQYPNLVSKIPNFLKHWRRQDKDLTIVMVGDSIGARDMHTTYFTAEEQTKRPPVLVSKNIASAIFDKLNWNSTQYRRFDATDAAVNTFTETGVFSTVTSNAAWDDTGDRPIHTRVSSTDGAAVSWSMAANLKRCNFIYRTELIGAEQITVTIADGVGKMQVYSEATDTWVEAHGYIFSTKQVTSTGVGNTTYQKRLKMKAVENSTVKQVTLTKSSTGTFCYWGIEYSKSSYILTLIDSHRGGHSTEMLSNYIVNDVIQHKPDLIIQQVPIMNMGCNYGVASTPTSQASRFDTYFFDPANANSMYSLTNGLSDCEFIIWMPNLGNTGNEVNDADATLNTWELSTGQIVDTMNYYRIFPPHVASKSSIPIINIAEGYLREAKMYAARSGRTLSQILKGTSPTGFSYTNDSLHPNDNGVSVMKKYFLPIFDDSAL